MPTSFIKGGGGGFYGLADTINGDFIAIPPIQLRLTAIGDYLKIIKGKLDVTLGPSYLAYGGRDIEIAGADVLDSFNMYLRLQGEKRTYKIDGKTTEYTGLRAGGGMSVTIKAPQEDFLIGTIFEVEGKAEASVFGGLDNYSKPTSAYIQLDSRGSISGKVMFPKKLGKINFRLLGGKTLAEASVDFIMGAQTAMTVDPASYAGKSVDEILSIAAKSAWDNLSVYGGVSTSGKLGIFYYRLYYVVPDHVGGRVSLRNINRGWSLEQEIDKNAWYVSGAQTLSGGPGWATQVGKCYDPETGEQVGIAVLEVSVYQVGEDGMPAMMAASPATGGYVNSLSYTRGQEASDSELGLLLTVADDGSVEELRSSLQITYTVGADTEIHTLALEDMDKDPDTINRNGNCMEIVEEGENGQPDRPGLLISTGRTGDQDYTWTITASCDFQSSVMFSAPLTTLDFSLRGGSTAESTVQHPDSGKEYAIRYYFDTARDRTGEHYFIDMQELNGQRTASFAVPVSGTLAPSGDYYVTAVLVEKVTGDFNGDGTVAADEWSWVTVDTQTSGDPMAYDNTMQPNAPTDVVLTADGNETLTAGWTAVEKGVDGYRVTLYYQENGVWKQAGAPYVLNEADFDAGSDIAAASRSGHRRMLRMAPTVGDAASAAPAGVSYKVTVESFKRDTELTSALYYSRAMEPAGGGTYLPVYTAPEVVVTTGNGQRVTLNGSSGYDSLLWNRLPAGMLFAVDGGVDGITVTPEQGSGSFTVSGGNGHWEVSAADADAGALIGSSGRVLLSVRSGLDTTEYYLRLMLDDVPPVITLDTANVRADMTTGDYTVSGQTEPGLTVAMESGNGTQMTAAADMQGRFTFKGKLPVNTENGFQTLVTEVTTQDEAGNSAAAPVLVSARPEIRSSDPEDGGSGGSGGSKSSSTGDPGVVLYAAAALLSLSGFTVLAGRKKRRG